MDFQNGIITVRNQLQKQHMKNGKYVLVSLKNEKVRRIKPAQFVMDILQQQRQAQLLQRLHAGPAWSNGWNLVFTNESGRYLCIPTVYNNFKRIVKRIGIPETRFHDMRHTFATISLGNGDDIKTLQENTGHATAAFTLDIYGHFSRRMRHESADRMQGYIDDLKSL